MQLSQSEKVLFVDDDRFILEAVRRLFRRRFEISVANSSQEALEMVSCEGPYAVIVSDRCMPGMDGLSFFKKVCNISPASTKIMMTGDNPLEIPEQAVIEAQIFRILTKPCPRELIQSTISAGLEQHRLVLSQSLLLK